MDMVTVLDLGEKPAVALMHTKRPVPERECSDLDQPCMRLLHRTQLREPSQWW